MSDGETAKPDRFRVRALERLKRIRQALAQRDWLGITIEVLVVTVGVLIAIFAEQLVESARWSREVREFRRAVDRDLAFSLGGYQLRLQQSDCLQGRITELERWRASWRQGRPKSLTGEIGRVLILAVPTSAWNARSSEVMVHMPFETRRDYGALNDTMANVTQQILEERETWRSFSAFNDVEQMSEDNMMRLSELIWRAKSYDRVLRTNASKAMRLAAQLGIEPGFGRDPDTQKILSNPNFELCRPILEP